MSTRNEVFTYLRSAIASSLSVITPETFSTQTLDNFAWMQLLEEPGTGLINLISPLVFIVEEDGADDGDSPWGELMSHNVQVLTTKVYLVLGSTTNWKSSLIARTGSTYDVVSAENLYVGQTITWDDHISKVTAVAPSALQAVPSTITVASPGTETGTFSVPAQSEPKLDCDYWLDLLRTSLTQASVCAGTDNVQLHTTRPINVSRNLDLNQALTGNRSDLWAGCLTLKWSCFYE